MGGSFSSTASPPLTEANLQSQSGKVFIVTGASSGYGRLLATILYQRHAKVYLAARDTTKLHHVADDLRQRFPNSTGEVHFFPLGLCDLSTIKKPADDFLAKESKLHVLWHNAGVMIPPAGLGPFLLTKFLYPALKNAAAEVPANSVRVVWVSSGIALWAPKPALDFENMDYHKNEGAWKNYGRSKAGYILQAAALARRGKDDGIVSVTLDPGVAMTGLQRTMLRWLLAIVGLFAQKPEIGAYTQLTQACTRKLMRKSLHPGVSHVTTTKVSDPMLINSSVISPGKLVKCRADLFDRELSERFWEWNEEHVKPYL
ncbi:hypothetical protein F1880_008392 [Penicillium rolfsii]|nr:hypothetical protein F1880_008392 [Penicillium rolfsii]